MSNLAKRASGAMSRGDGPKLSGAEKSLLFLVSLDEPVATRILAQLTDEEVVVLRRASGSLRQVDPDVIMGVHEEFASHMQAGVPTSLKGSSAYLRRLAGKALGEGRVAELWDDSPKPVGAIARLSELDNETILALLEPEQPQTVALLLAQFEPARTADILTLMSPDKQANLVLRIAKLKAVPESVIRSIETQLVQEIDALSSDEKRDLRGLDVAAALVKRLDKEISETLLEEMAALDNDIAEEMRKNLFTFEDLLKVDGRGMQQLLKEISTDQLVIALKTASEDLREKVFGNMSSRAGNMLREELEMLGPVRVSEVQEAQAAIVEIALQLEQDGRITIARDGGAEFV